MFSDFLKVTGDQYPDKLLPHKPEIKCANTQSL
jgi:hypothetical protein